MLPERLRVGRRVGRTIYTQAGETPSDGDELVGVMDTRELAAAVVAAYNEGKSAVCSSCRQQQCVCTSEADVQQDTMTAERRARLEEIAAGPVREETGGGVHGVVATLLADALWQWPRLPAGTMTYSELRDRIAEEVDCLARDGARERATFDRLAASSSSVGDGGGEYPSYGDLVAALDAAGATLTNYEPCPHQGVRIGWERPRREGEVFLGLPVADPVASEVVEYHYAPHDQIPASPNVMRETTGRALQRAVWDLRADRLPTRSEVPGER